jgi:hypothetical protein
VPAVVAATPLSNPEVCAAVLGAAEVLVTVTTTVPPDEQADARTATTAINIASTADRRRRGAWNGFTSVMPFLRRDRPNRSPSVVGAADASRR